MVEKNSFLGNMMDKTASGGNKPTDAVSRVDKPSTPNYDVATFNIIKLRLIEQRTQLNRMVDYSQDAAIKLNDIYEILKDMRGSSDKEVTRVDEEQIVYQSSLDTFFKQNGYIPVKILNPQDGGDFEIDIDGKKRRRRFGKGKWGAVLGALAAIAGVAGIAALGGSMNDMPELPTAEPIPTPDLLPVEPVPAPDLIPQSEVVPGNDLPVEPFGIPSISSPSSSPIQIPEATAPDVIPAPGPSPLSGLTDNKTLASIMTALAGLMATVQMLSSRAAGAPPVGVGGVDSMFNRARPRLGGGGRISAMPDAELLLMSMKDTQGPGVKILTLSAKEINFEADKFDFIQRSLFATPSPTNNMVTPVSYSQPSTGGGGGSTTTDDTGYASGPDGGGATGGSSAYTPGYGGGAAQSGRAASGGGTVRGDSAVTPGMGAAMPNIPAGGTITQQQAYQLALGAGFTPEEAKIMAAIAVGESSLNSSAFNGNASTGDESYGLWQINMIGKLGPERRAMLGIESNDQLFDPATNARAAYQIYKMQGFDAWSVYKTGKYKQYVNADLSGGSTTAQGQSTAAEGMAAISGVKPAISSFLSGISDALAGLSKDVTMNLETPRRPTTGGAVNIVNNVSPSVPPAYRGVDEPMAAMDDMIEKLLGEMV